jgi:stage V sporulation protein G
MRRRGRESAPEDGEFGNEALKLSESSSILRAKSVTCFQESPMEITEVRVNLQDEEVLKAFVSITLDDEFVIRGLKVIQGMDGRFVAMPARKKKDGTFQDIAHPINRETRRYLEDVVLKAYDEEVEAALTTGRQKVTT